MSTCGVGSTMLTLHNSLLILAMVNLCLALADWTVQ